MTLDTRVYVHDRVDYREVFVKCSQLLGAHEGIRSKTDGDSVHNLPGQGLPAWLFVYCDPQGNRPRQEPGQHDKYCEGEEDDCLSPCGVACWLEVSFDTSYGYRGPDGGCGDLHARLVAQLGQWLDGKGVAWSWRNEFTGEVRQGYDGLEGLMSGGAEAADWYRDIVVPAIAVRMAREAAGG